MAQSLEPACYRDDEFVERDLALLGHSWLGVGRSDMLTGQDAYQTLDIGDRSAILVRDDSGALRAFANACRHRGARLLEGSGTCRTVKCPFHAWTYARNGALTAAPRMRDVDGFSKDDFGLLEYRVEERLGFVFLCFDPEAQSLDETLGDFASVHAPWPLDDLVTTRRREFIVDCNWKSFLEVFNEYYHLPYVHYESLGNAYAEPDACDDTKGAFTSQFGLTRGTGALLKDQQHKPLPSMRGLVGKEAGGVRYTWVFPTMTFAVGFDALWAYEAYPLGAHQCRVVQSACLPPETLATEGAQQKVADYHHRLDASLAEDLPVLVGQHRGLSNPDARTGPLHPGLEPSVGRFAQWYVNAIAEHEQD